MRTWLFSAFVGVLGLAVAGAAAVSFDAPADRPFALGWPVLALGFVLAERFVVHLEVRQEAHTLAFSEVPLTIGLIFADPEELILARIVAATLTVALVRRLPPVKLLFNGGQFALDVGIAVFVFHTVLGGGEPVEPIGWLAAITAVIASHLASAMAVTSVMRIAGAPITPRSVGRVILVSLSASVAGCATALGAAGALWRDQSSWVLLLVICGALGYFFISFVRIRDRHQDLSTLHRFTTSLSADGGPEELGATVATGIADLLKAQRVVVLLPDEDAFLRIEARDGETSIDRRHQVAELEWASATGLVDRTISHGTQKETIAGVELLTSNVITARLSLPERSGLVIADGRLSAARSFDDEDIQLLETASGHAASALRSAQLVVEFREEARFRARQALRDDVTELPNSRGLAEDLVRPLATRVPLVIVTVRIDSLREVNETLGRAMGDELLRQVASRLVPLGTEDWCAKTASDEFTLVVPGGPDEAEMLANRVISAFEAPVSCGDVALAVNAGIGVALAPEHGGEVEILLRRASLAASRCHVEGTKVTTWAADRDPYDPQRLAIAADLRKAIPGGELRVHFQPQVDIASGLVTGAEALVRWDHPRLGELRPDQFIAAAEYTGAIDALTVHVLEVAARTCQRWRAQGWDLDVAVNVSARNLSNARFAEEVRDILRITRLDPSALTLEITESSVMTGSEPALATLHELHRLGVSWSIDDFGTGYSSLAHLRRLPVSEIKIDKSFVFDLVTNQSDEAIVRSMIDLGRNLGMSVVVEGVETVEVRRRLDELGTDRIQGYLLSRPVPVPAFESWIADRPVRMAELSERSSDRPVRGVADMDPR